MSIPRYEIRNNRVRAVSSMLPLEAAPLISGGEGFGSLLQPGKPYLPARVVWIRIPPTAESIECRVTRRLAPLTGRVLVDNVPSLVIEGSSPLKPAIEEFKVKGDSIYPSRAGRYLGTTEFMCYKLAKVMIFPAAYNLMTQELLWSTDIKINLDYTTPGTPDILPEIITFDKIAHPNSNDYVIVVAQGLMSAVKEFAKWKETIGYKVQIISWDKIDETLNLFQGSPKYILAIGEPTETQSSKLKPQNSIIGWIPYKEPHIVSSILERSIEFEINHKRKEILFVKGIANYWNEDFSGVPQEDKSELLKLLKSIAPEDWGCEEFQGEGIPGGYSIINFLTLAKNWLSDDGDRVPETQEIKMSNYFLCGDGLALVFAPFRATEFLKEGAVCVVAPDSTTTYVPGWKEPEDGGSQSFNYAFIKYLAEKKIVGDAFIQSKFWYDTRFPQAKQEFKIWGDPSLNIEGIPGVDIGITGLGEAEIPQYVGAPIKWLPPDSTIVLTCVLHNFGRTSEVGCKIYCEIDSSGFPIYTGSVVLDTIHPMESDTVKFDEWSKYKVGTVYRVRFKLFSPRDENPSNDTISVPAQVAGGDFITSDTVISNVLCGLGYKGVLVGTIKECPPQWIKNFRSIFLSAGDTSGCQLDSIPDSANLYIEGDNLWLEKLVQGKKVKAPLVSPISGMGISFTCKDTTFEWFIPNSSDTLFLDATGTVCGFSNSDKYKIWCTKFKIKEIDDTLRASLIQLAMGFFGVESAPATKTGIPEEISNIRISCIPNPFYGATNIKLTITKYPTRTSITIYNLAGIPINKICESQMLEVGEYEFKWDAKGESATPVVAGIYFMRLETETENKLMKLIVLR